MSLIPQQIKMPKYEYQKDSSIVGNIDIKYYSSPGIAELRAKTFEAEALMKTMPQVKLEVVHTFSPGIYARELHIPAGVTLTGQIHKFKNLNILSKGTMLVSTEDGVKEVSAPFTVVSPAGTKRIAYAVTDCVWTTILATEETDVPTIEKHFVTDSETEWLAFSGKDQLSLGF